MNNKKSIMALSAMMILIFHLWVYVFPGNWIEQYVRWSAFIGVDIFFILSAYSLTKHAPGKYVDFILGRFRAVYLKFILFSIVAAVVSGWTITRLLLTASGIQLWQKGGGAFLWFLPAIMLFYLAFPFLRKLYEKNMWLGFILMLAVWLTVGILVSTFTSYRAMFIYWNRIPALALGMLWCMLEDRVPIANDNAWFKVFTGVILLALGTVIMYYAAYRNMLSKPIADMFYVMALPSAIGIIFIVSLLPENRVIRYIGASTLEMYAVQMIFGYKWAQSVLKITDSPILTNIVSIALVTIVAVMTNQVYSLVSKGLGRYVANRKK